MCIASKLATAAPHERSHEQTTGVNPNRFYVGVCLCHQCRQTAFLHEHHVSILLRCGPGVPAERARFWYWLGTVPTELH